MHNSSLLDEAEKCRRLACELVGGSERQFLLRAALVFDKLASGSSPPGKLAEAVGESRLRASDCSNRTRPHGEI